MNDIGDLLRANYDFVRSMAERNEMVKYALQEDPGESVLHLFGALARAAGNQPYRAASFAWSTTGASRSIVILKFAGVAGRLLVEAEASRTLPVPLLPATVKVTPLHQAEGWTFSAPWSGPVMGEAVPSVRGVRVEFKLPGNEPHMVESAAVAQGDAGTDVVLAILDALSGRLERN